MQVKTLLNNNGYMIELDSLPKTNLKYILSDLTVTPYRLDATKEEMEASKFSLFRYSECKKYIIVPRYYGIQKFGEPNITEFNPEKIFTSFSQTLREKQIVVTQKCIKYMKKHGGGLLSVPCGFGKTVCALYIAQYLGLKTLVIVHKSFLLKQWKDRAKEFMNITDDRIGTIRQKECDVDDKDIVIGMIQTIAKKEYRDVFSQFGLVVYDEAHHVASRHYSKCLAKTGAKYTLALTATPYRGDGLIKIMYWFTGGTIYREKMKTDQNVIVKMIYYKSTDTKLFSNKRRWFQGKTRSDTNKMITNVCKIKSRNDKIIEMVTHIRRTEPERKILILSGRKDHLDILKRGVDQEINKDIKNGLIDQDEVYSCYYIGDTKPIDRQEAEDRGDIIFATYAMANEGLDIKHLNTVILACPKKDVVQSIGRIMRTILCSGSLRPMIIDIGDDVYGLNNWINVRNIVYTKCKYAIEKYYLIDNDYKTSFEYDNIDISIGIDQLHHEDPFIHNMINNYNKNMISFKKDVELFQNLTNEIDEMIINRIPELNLHQFIHPPIINKDYQILDNLYTNLPDIMFVDKLKERDFERKLLKDAENIETINLDEDIELGNDDDDNIDLILSKMQKGRTNESVPSKKLFR